MSSEQRKKRKGYEFSNSTKMEGLRRSKNRCEWCGKHAKEVGRLEFHHVLGIAIAKKYYPELSREIIRSLANLEILCETCHNDADKEDQANHKVIAQALLGMVRQKALL